MNTAVLVNTGDDHRITKPLGDDWHLWCRLCAKVDIQNVNIFFKDEHLPTSTGNIEQSEFKLAKAIVDHFRVNISHNEELPKLLCTECFSLVTSVVNLSERVIRVQQMYAELQNMHDGAEIDLTAVRLKYNVLEEGHHQLFMPHTLPEVHLFEAKPKVNEYKEHIFVNESIVPSLVGTPRINIKKEHMNDNAEADEDAYEFENEEEEGEDPFGSEIEGEHNGKKTFHLKPQEVDRSSGNSSQTEIEELVGEIRKKLRKRGAADKAQKVAVTSEEDLNQYKYSCTKCPQRFQRISNYRVHMKKKHGIVGILPPFACPQCPRSFRIEYELKRHMKKHQPLAEKRIYPCPHCDRKFQTKDYVAQHIKFVHEDERSFICEECGDAVRTKGALQEHMLTHTDYAPVECKVCGKCFKHETRLKKHMEIHDPHKHICGECGFQLNSRATLKRHMLVHSNVMLHKCDYCGRAFKRSKTLKNHLILHTGLKPYSCDFCDRTFANGSNCRTHKRKAHPVELAALEASGGKTYTKNIPKLAVLKSVTRVADNLTPVVSKQSGNFAFGKKPKLSPDAMGTVSKKQFKKDFAGPPERTTDLETPPVVPLSLSNNQKITEDNIGAAVIPINDNKYSQLIKQTQDEFCSQPHRSNQLYDFGHQTQMQ